MQVELEEVSPVLTKMKVVIPADIVQEESQRILKAYTKKAKIPGFRPGKAPLSIIEAVLGARVPVRSLDGDLDLVIVNLNGSLRLLRNEGGTGNNWLTVIPKLPNGKSDALGAQGGGDDGLPHGQRLEGRQRRAFPERREHGHVEGRVDGGDVAMEEMTLAYEQLVLEP